MRDEPLAEHGDRALAVGGEVDERAPLEPVAGAGVELDAERRELLGRAAPGLVASERGEERRGARELEHLHGGDRAAARRLGPELVRGQDLAALRQPLDDDAVGELDVPDGRHPRADQPCPPSPRHHASGAAARVRGAQGRGGELRHPRCASSPRLRTRTRAARRPSARRTPPPATTSARTVARAPTRRVTTSPARRSPARGARSAVGQRAGHVEHGARRPARDVERARDRLGRGERAQVGARDVAHVDEVAPLAAVLEHARRAAGGVGGAEDARDAGVGRVARHPRAVDVVVAQRGDGHARLARVTRRTGAPARAWSRRTRCAGPAARPPAPSPAASGRPQRGQGGSKRPASRSAATRCAGRDHAVLGARVAALAVDDHARGEHEPAGEAARGERAQQLRGGEVVVGDVLGQVAEVDAEPDHRRLVAHVVDAVDRARRDLRVAQVALDPLRGGIEVVRPHAVRGGQQRVDRAHRDARARAARRRRASR